MRLQIEHFLMLKGLRFNAHGGIVNPILYHVAATNHFRSNQTAELQCIAYESKLHCLMVFFFRRLNNSSIEKSKMAAKQEEHKFMTIKLACSGEICMLMFIKGQDNKRVMLPHKREKYDLKDDKR